MKFVIALFALVACAAANYVTPVVQTAYATPAVAAGAVAAYPWAHYRERRQIYTPAVYTAPAVGYAQPWAGVHYRERRQIYTPAAYVSTGYYPYAGAAVHYRERRQIYTPTVYSPGVGYAQPWAGVHYRERRQLPYYPHAAGLAYDTTSADNHFAHHY